MANKRTDPYLTNYKAKYRLLKEYKQHGMLVVAYDFDNTVYDYHKTNWEYRNMIKLLKRAKDFGCYLIIFTAAGEERYDEIIKYCKENDIPFDAINENYPLTNTNGRKLYYNILLDDRAGLKQAYEDLNKCFDIIEEDAVEDMSNLPEIDIDIYETRKYKDEILKYINQKYGKPGGNKNE